MHIMHRIFNVHAIEFEGAHRPPLALPFLQQFILEVSTMESFS